MGIIEIALTGMVATTFILHVIIALNLLKIHMVKKIISDSEEGNIRFRDYFFLLFTLKWVNIFYSFDDNDKIISEKNASYKRAMRNVSLLRKIYIILFILSFIFIIICGKTGLIKVKNH